MRAWAQRDARAMKALTARNFILLMAAKPPVLLDYSSWVEAAATRWACSSYRFGDLHVRELGGGFALFAAKLEIEAGLDGADWSGRFWVTDLWRKGRLRRSWRMVERIVSLSDDNPEVPAGIRALQLWRPARRARDRSAEPVRG